MATNTPGPWAVNPACAQVDAFAPHPVPVCRLLWPTDERSEEETEANARLIAAAPDMLDALHQASAVLSGATICETNRGIALRSVRAAIALTRAKP